MKRNSFEMKKKKITVSESSMVGTEREIIKRWFIFYSLNEFYPLNISISISSFWFLPLRSQASRRAGWRHKAVGKQHALVSFPSWVFGNTVWVSVTLLWSLTSYPILQQFNLIPYLINKSMSLLQQHYCCKICHSGYVRLLLTEQY